MIGALWPAAGLLLSDREIASSSPTHSCLRSELQDVGPPQYFFRIWMRAYEINLSATARRPVHRLRRTWRESAHFKAFCIDFFDLLREAISAANRRGWAIGRRLALVAVVWHHRALTAPCHPLPIQHANQCAGDSDPKD